MELQEIKHFLEAAMLAAGRPLNVDQLRNLFDGRMAPEKAEIRKAIAELNEEYEPRGIVVSEVASGFRMQVRASMAARLEKLWEERPPRYSRALFETLALIAYRQPVTRGEIEEIRGVSVSTNIVRQVMERDWVRVVGHRDVPGRPAMFGTTKTFLDYFGLKKLDDLPPLADLSDWESLRVQLNLPEVEDSDSPDFSVPDVVESEQDAVPAIAANDEVTTADETSRNDLPAVQPEGEASPTELPDLEDDELIVSEWPEPVG